MSKAQRDKGNRWERAVVNAFKRVLDGVDIRRCWQRQRDHTNPDVTAGPFWVECKHQVLPNIWKALEQAEKNAPGPAWPIAVCKRGRCSDGKAVVAIRLDDFLDLVGEWWERGA